MSNPSPHWDNGGIDGLRKKRVVSMSEMIEPIIDKYEEMVKDFPDNPEPIKLPDLKTEINRFKNDFAWVAKKMSAQEGFEFKYRTEKDYEFDGERYDLPELLNQLVLYFMGLDDLSQRVILYYSGFNLNPHKGIMFVGAPGCGKSFIMRVFAHVLKERNSTKAFLFKPVTEICDEFGTLKPEAQAEFFNNYGKRITGFLEGYQFNHLCPDDLGKEEYPRKLYSFNRNPMISIINDREVRQKHGIQTHATCNFTFEDMEHFYGKALVDRFKKMFNVIIFHNKSMRG